MMTHRLLALSFGFAALIAATQQGFAQAGGAQCAERAKVLAHLAATYGETRRGVGLAANNAVMEVFAAESGSWTITVTLPSGMTCLVASGQGYETLADPLPASGDDA